MVRYQGSTVPPDNRENRKSDQNQNQAEHCGTELSDAARVSRASTCPWSTCPGARSPGPGQR